MSCTAGGVKGTKEMQLQEKSLDRVVSAFVFYGRKVIISEHRTYTLKGLKRVYYVANVEVKNPELVNGDHAAGLEGDLSALRPFSKLKFTAGFDTNVEMNSVSFDTENLPDYELKDVIKSSKDIATDLNEFYDREV